MKINIILLISIFLMFSNVHADQEVVDNKIDTTEIDINYFITMAAFDYDDGNFDKALEKYNKVLKIIPKNDSRYSLVCDRLGHIYLEFGNYDKALEYFKNTLKIEKTKAHIHPLTYTNIGEVYFLQNDYFKALRYYQKSLQISMKISNGVNTNLIITQNKIGNIFRLLGMYRSAMRSLKECIEINDILRKKEALNIFHLCLNLSSLYEKTGDTKQASYYSEVAFTTQKAMSISTSSTYEYMDSLFDKDRKKIIRILEDRFYRHKKIFELDVRILADTYYFMGLLGNDIGDYTIAKSFIQDSIDLSQKRFRDDHAIFIAKYYELSVVYEKEHNYIESYKYIKKSFDIYIRNRDKNFQILSKLEKEKYFRKNDYIINILLKSVYLYNKKSVSQQLSQTTLTDWLNYKGSIGENSNLLRAIQDTTNSNEVKEKIDRYFEIQKQIGFLYSSLANKSEEEIESTQKVMKGLEQEITDIEQYLTQSVEKYKDYQKLKIIDYKQIATILKDDELYIDYAVTQDNYYVFTLDNKGNVSFDRLAKTDDINKAIEKFRRNIDSISPADYPKLNTKEDIKYKNETKQTLYEIYKLVMEPIKEKVASKKKLIISQDGKLNLIPFETLYDDKDTSKGKYLVESKTIRYTPSGKSLLQLYMINKDKNTTNKKVELFYNPSFNMKLDEEEKIYLSKTTLTGPMKRARANNGMWPTLKGTESEGEAIQKIYSKKYTIDDNHKKEANIEKLLTIKEPTILHIATHGYFLDDPEITNPLLKSGIVLAGANSNPAYGQVSALKLSGLDLKGTQVVVLSACETGVSMDGLSGLNKVFIQAGAKAVISSLWKVPDQETKNLMVSMHKEIKEGRSSYKALKDAKEKFIQRDVHPYFWAAFIYSGI